MHSRFILALAWALGTAGSLYGTEPNETFADASDLASGVLSVSDDLAQGSISHPDTVLGTLDFFGSVYFVDDDSSPLGDGSASGIGGVPTNSGSIDFLISGYPDDGFVGNHGEYGGYEVFIDVYDFFDDLVDSFSETAILQPGNVDGYTFSNSEWIGGSYDVYIDNTVGDSTPADVDFFTFSGLAAGATFTAEVTQEIYSGFDSYLGWFSEDGQLLDADDDDGMDNLSLLVGTVPVSGVLTFAITGFGDDQFLGAHSESAMYSLELILSEVLTLGDYNEDGSVDAADYTVWRDNLNSSTSLPNDNSPGVGLDDYERWKDNFGQPGSGSLTPPQSGGDAAVPEPAAFSLVFIVLLSVGLQPRHFRAN